MTLQEQAKEIVADMGDLVDTSLVNKRGLEIWIYGELQKAFRGGQRAEQERSGKQPSLETLACEGCHTYHSKLTYREGKLLCDTCKDVADREEAQR